MAAVPVDTPGAGSLSNCLRSIGVRVTLLAALFTAACGQDAIQPATSLVGSWDLVGFTDAGTAATTTGTWVFREDGTFSVSGTVTFPGEPTDSIVQQGSYLQQTDRVTLTMASQTGIWWLAWSDNRVTLTRDAAPPANTITLQRQ